MNKLKEDCLGHVNWTYTGVLKILWTRLRSESTCLLEVPEGVEVGVTLSGLDW